MRIMYKCCMCGKMYDYYGIVHENSNYSYEDKRKAERQGKEYTEKSGVSVKANAIMFKCVDHVPDIDGEKLEIHDADGNLEGLALNLCEECMHSLLEKCKPDEDNCFGYV